MQRSTAHIFCIETPWSTDLRRRSTVRPLLELLESQNAVRFIHRDAATVGELEHYLGKWTQQRYADHSLGYFAFHEQEDGLLIGRKRFGLERMQELLAGALKGRTVYFSSCATLGIDDALIDEFRRTTGARAVCGFSKDVDWMDAAAFDLSLLEAVTRYSRPSDAFRHLKRNHDGSVRRLGFRAAWNGGGIG